MQGVCGIRKGSIFIMKRKIKLIDTKMLDLIYDSLNDSNKERNLFETAETNEKYENFCDKYIYNTKEIKAGQNDMWDCFVKTLMLVRKQAFRIGFRTGMQLSKELSDDE